MFLTESQATVTGNVISGNSARDGGGVYVQDGEVTLEGNRIEMNQAQEGAGLFLNPHTAVIRNNDIINNRASTPHGGGGIKIVAWASRASSFFTISDNNLHSNTSGSGGGIPNDLTSGRPSGSTDLDAENNWWGTTDMAAIEEQIWHFVDDAALGLVDFAPILMQPELP